MFQAESIERGIGNGLRIFRRVDISAAAGTDGGDGEGCAGGDAASDSAQPPPPPPPPPPSPPPPAQKQGPISDEDIIAAIAACSVSMRLSDVRVHCGCDYVQVRHGSSPLITKKEFHDATTCCTAAA